MASAQAKIEVVVKNLRSLDKIEKALTKINSQNDKLIASLDKVVGSLSNIEKAVVGVGKEATNSQKQLAGTTTQTTKLLKGQVSKWYGIRQTINAVVGALRNAGLAAFNFNKSMMKTWQLTMKLQKFNKNLYVDYFAQSKAPLSELNQIISNLQKELSQYHSSQMRLVGGDQKAIDVKNQLAGALREQSVEQAKVNNLLKEAQGITQLGPGGKGRGFGSRFVNTPEREAAKARDRAINQRRAEAITDRFNRTRQLQRGIEFKNLPTVKLQRQLLAIEKKRELLLRRQVRRQEKLNMMAEAQGMVGSTGYTAAQYGPQPLPLTRAEKLGFGQKGRANPQGMFASRGGPGGRLRGAASSAMIGGGFPLLFGQGKLGALGGGLGGAVGGALGGGFGFGFSIVGTALASAAQDAINFQKSIDEVNRTIRSTGSESLVSAQNIRKLAKDLNITKEEALEATKAFAQFGGKERTSISKTFGKDPSAFYGLTGATDTLKVVEQINAFRSKDNKINDERAKQLLEILNTEGLIAAQIALRADAEDRTGQLEEARKVTMQDRLQSMSAAQVYAENMHNVLGEQALEMMEIDFYGKQRVKDLEKEFAIQDQVFTKQQEWEKRLSNAIKVAQVKTDLENLLDPMNQLITAADGIANAFSTSFRGIVSGTMSVQQALASLFQNIANSFADMAAQILAAQIRAKIVGIFASSFASAAGGSGFSTEDFMSGGYTATSADTVAGGGFLEWNTDMAIPKKYASGGYVTRPTVGLVGEAGESEYVIPASKMASSMQRYSAGARGEAVVAGGGSSYAGGGTGGSTTVSYSGPILNFNSEEFVPKSAVGQIIATATSQGARAGENRTLSTLRNSRSARSRLGM